jgi:hypothetical protein
MSQDIGGTVARIPKKNSLQALVKLKPNSGQEYNVLAYVLNRDMIKPDGTLDDIHGIVFPLGSFSSKEKAEDHAKTIIESTGHPAVVVAGYGYPVRLTPNLDSATTVDVPVDIKGKLINMEDAQFNMEKATLEKKIKLEKELLEEAERETNPSDIEHYKRQWYLAIKNHATYLAHKKIMEEAQSNYQKRVKAIQDHYTKYPDHDTKIMNYLKEKLVERGEGDLYDSLEVAYNELHPTVIGTK